MADKVLYFCDFCEIVQNHMSKTSVIKKYNISSKKFEEYREGFDINANTDKEFYKLILDSVIYKTPEKRNKLGKTKTSNLRNGKCNVPKNCIPPQSDYKIAITTVCDFFIANIIPNLEAGTLQTIIDKVTELIEDNCSDKKIKDLKKYEGPSFLAAVFVNSLANNTKPKQNKTVADSAEADPDLPQAHECERKQVTQAALLKNTVPAPYLNFVAREDELIEMEKKLTEHHYLFLEGMGGIGKTELAKQYAKQHSEQYDAVQLVHFDKDIRTTVALGLSFHGICEKEYEERFGASNFINKLFEDKLSALRNNSVRSLIIIDNAIDVDISKILAPTGEYDIICTTREKCHGKSVLEVKPLNDKQLLALFCEYYELPISSDDEPIINGIINLVLGHTMTVMIIALTMRESDIKPKNMLQRLQKSLTTDLRTKIAINKEDISDKEREKAMCSHLENLFDMAALQSKDSYARIMTNMAIISYSGISKERFYDLVLLKHYKDNNRNNPNFTDLNKLIKLRWIQCNEEQIPKISLHPVISEVASTQFKPDSEKCRDLLQSMLIYADECSRQTYVERNVCAKRLRFACNRIKNETVTTARLHKSYGQILTQLADFRDVFIYLDKAKNIIENIDENHVEAAEIYEAIAAVYYEFDDDEALEWDDMAFVIYLERRDDKSLSSIENHINEAKLEAIVSRKGGFDFKDFDFWCDKGALPDGAIVGLEKSAESLEKSEKELELLFSTYTKIGNFRLAGNENDKALEAFQKALEIGETVYGEIHPKIADVYFGIAQCQSDNKKASKWQDKAIAIYEAIFGKNHTKIVKVCLKIAKCQRDNNEVLKWQNKAIDVCEAIPEENSAQLANVYFDIAECQSDNSESLKWLYKALAIYEAIHGKSCPKIADYYEIIAEKYYSLGEHEKASECYQKALDIWQEFE